jgi:Holliday junction resolvase-like predicted endonuclease
LSPEDNLTSTKLKKLQRTAALYAGYNQNLINDDLGWRIDLVAIAIPKDVSRETLVLANLTNIEKYCDIKHFENI